MKLKILNAVAHFIIFAIGSIQCYATQSKPNILTIIVDDLRPVLGSYGHEVVVSPHIDSLANAGMTFTRAYANIPVCGASRASFMTSIRATSKRFVNFMSKAETDAPGAKSIPQVFKENGYYTISNGKVFHHRDDLNEQSWSEPAWRPRVGMQTSYNPESKKYRKQWKNGKDVFGPWYESANVDDDAYFDGLVAKKTIHDLQKLKKLNKPFFLAAGFFRPHLPFYAPKKYYDLYDPKQIKLAQYRQRPKNAPVSLRGSVEITMYHFKDIVYNSDEFHLKSLHAYYASVSYIDKLIGDIIAELERLKLRENTIIVLWSDHGWNLGEHNFWGKHNMMQHALRVPLIIDAPGYKNNIASSAVVELVDLFPTLAELAMLPLGDKTKQQLHGKSLVPLLSQTKQKIKDYVYARFRNGETIISDRYTFTEYQTKDGIEYMLYDLSKDPEENNNIYVDPESKRISTELKMILNAEREKLSL